MRRIEDRREERWDVVVGRESWGAFYALFVPVGEPTDRPIRQVLLDVEGQDGAARMIQDSDEEHLLDLLRRSELKS